MEFKEIIAESEANGDVLLRRFVIKIVNTELTMAQFTPKWQWHKLECHKDRMWWPNQRKVVTEVEIIKINNLYTFTEGFRKNTAFHLFLIVV